jgi:hypothetical protein
VSGQRQNRIKEEKQKDKQKSDSYAGQAPTLKKGWLYQDHSSWTWESGGMGAEKRELAELGGMPTQNDALVMGQLESTGFNQ